MRNPVLVAGGLIALVLGLVFFFQGIGVITGSTMTDTVTWSVLGPLIALAGLAAIVVGGRRTRRGEVRPPGRLDD